MRLTTVILIATLLQVNASGFGQKITYVKKNKSLFELFNAIKEQTGYKIVWSSANFDADEIIPANFRKVPVEEVLNKALSGLPVTYIIADGGIVIKAIEPSFRDQVAGFFAAIDVRGRVLDDRNAPLVGAVVKVKGTTRTVVTDNNGEFVFKGINEKSVLIISYLGYEPQEVAASKDLGDIKLVMGNDDLDEVEINAGYYTIKDKERTGSISRVTSKDIERQPVSNLLGALMGRMSGVNIEQQSGVNGGGFKVQIRGQNSLRNVLGNDGNQPLYLIDGVPFPSSPITNSTYPVAGLSTFSSPLNYINPLDVETIEVLKDGDATAIYGSRGANGVVLITTKKAKIGKTVVDFNAYKGISKAAYKLDLLNTEQYLIMREEAFKNDDATPIASDYDLNGTWDKNSYTDWQDLLIGGTAQNTNLQTSLSGGNESTQFFLRGNYSKNTTVTPGDFSEQKGGGTFTANHSGFNNRLKVAFSGTYGINYNTLPRDDVTQYLNLPPNAPAPFNEDGSLNWALTNTGAATRINPFAGQYNPYTGKTNNFLSNLSLNYQLLKGINLKSNMGYTNIRLKENILNPIIGQIPSSSTRGSNRITLNTIETWIFEPQITYEKKFGTGILNFLFGSTFQKDSQNSESLTGSDYTSDLFITNISAAPSKGITATSSQYKYQALFARLNYNYDNKYFINFTGRRDGSSRFGSGKQFANFGAIGGAWIFTNESIFKSNLPLLSLGKLRGSYGLTGNDQIPNYGYLETYGTTAAYQNGSGLFPSRIANPDYSWETNKKLEAAVDLGFLNNRILFSASYYHNKSSNQLVGFTLPDIAGFASVQYNLPATVQNNGWEFEINSSNMTTQLFSWKTSFNLTIPKNKLLSYPNIEGSSYANTYIVGESLFTPRVYQYTGFDSQTGLFQFSDLDGNGAYNTLDKIIAPKPLTVHFFGGIQNSLSYKNISLDLFFQFSSKTSRYPFAAFGAPGGRINQPIDVMERWQNPGDVAPFQKFTQKSIVGGARQRFSYYSDSDQLTDASFIRLKNVFLSWSLPKGLLERIRLNNAKIYIQGQNLWTITNYPFDPETFSIFSLPTLRTVTLGVQLSL